MKINKINRPKRYLPIQLALVAASGALTSLLSGRQRSSPVRAEGLEGVRLGVLPARQRPRLTRSTRRSFMLPLERLSEVGTGERGACWLVL